MYYYIVDKNFSKGLSNYLNKFFWNIIEIWNFINKIVETTGEKYNDLKELCDKCIKEAELNLLYFICLWKLLAYNISMKFLWIFKMIHIILKVYEYHNW